VAWTTFHNWAEVGDWYRGLALGRTAPDDAVKAKAAELTKDAKTPEDQVRALYNYVSQHNRYIGIDFGIGRFQPHGAAEVLANQYGDCKDKDTLLEALLHAQGFTTTPALIGAGIAPVPEVPSPAVFNHVITTVNLAGAQIWLDSTPQAAPYRYLVPMIRDEKALVIPADAPATLQSTPANPPYAFTEDFAAKGALDKDGKLTAQMSVTCHDDSELILRALAVNVAPNDWDKASQYISSASGFGGTTSNTQFAHADDNSVPMTMTYDYTRHPYGDWDNHRIVPLFPYAEFPALESDSTEPQDDIQLGSPRTLKAVSRIKLPDGYRTDLPDAVHVKTDFAIYDKTYKFEGQEIIAERTIVVLKKKVPKEQWKAYYDFTKKVGVVDGESWISLIAPLPTFPLNSIGHDTSGTAANAKNDSSTEKKDDSGDKKSPVSADVKVTGKPIGTPVAWSDDEKAQIARAQKSGPEAMRKELAELQAKRYLPEWEKRAAETPDDARIVLGLANTQKMSGDPDAGRKTAQGFLDKHPDNALAAEYLAAVETQDGDYGTALRTLQGAAEKNPTDVPLKINVSQALRRLNRNEDAAAMAKTAVAAADSPGLLNDAAYSLSETGLDLDVAEAASRKSIDELEAKSATITTEEVNSRAFGDANLLIASWDTLGWILNAEGKADAAQPLIQAAWRASLRSEIGDHLAQIEEQAGHKDEAATTYGLAQSALDQNSPDEVRQHITNALARLKAAGVKAGPSGADALQDLRTWKIKCPADVSGWGAFRLVIATSGVVEVQQMSGSGKIDGVKPAVAAMKFPELLWPGSKAHLLRSAVVSCTAGATCDVVMVPDGGLQTEAAAGPVAQ
jgi:tetratricopeptide (TPR) repeat protein